MVQPIGDHAVRKGANGKVVELHHVPNEHSDGLLAVYLPVEKLLWTADLTVVNPTPVQLGVLKSAVATFDRLKLDYNTWLPAHPPTPDKPLTKADVMAAVGAGTSRRGRSRRGDRPATPPPTRRPDPPSSRVAFPSRSDRSRSR